MKKLLLMAAVAGLFTVTSCKKDYTCNCTVGSTTTPTTIENVSKADAEAACDALDAINQIVGGSCALD